LNRVLVGGAPSPNAGKATASDDVINELNTPITQPDFAPIQP